MKEALNKFIEIEQNPGTQNLLADLKKCYSEDLYKEFTENLNNEDYNRQIENDLKIFINDDIEK